MKKVRKKPIELSTRQTAAALSRLNNCLPLFPGASEDSKFTPRKLLEILECSLPLLWWQKFDLDGYIPTDGSQAELIQHCEAIEHCEMIKTLKNQKSLIRKTKHSTRTLKSSNMQRVRQRKRARLPHTSALSMGRITPTTLQTVGC